MNGKIDMESKTQTLEAEVVEIDGVAPIPPQQRQADPKNRSWQDWRSWQGRVRTLDARWWPLWLILGIIALSLVLTVGLVLGVIILLVRITLGIIRGVFSIFAPPQSGALR